MVEYVNTKKKRYFLHKKIVVLRSKRGQTIYFFSTKMPNPDAPTVVPEGFTIEENSRSQMPYLKRLR